MGEITYGIYEQLLTNLLRSQLNQLDQTKSTIQFDSVEDSLLPDYLTRTLHEHIRRRLSGIKGREERYATANKVLHTLLEGAESIEDLSDSILIDQEANLLSEIRPAALGKQRLPRPSVPLKFSCLFTGATGSPQLGKELELEFETADRIDLLVSFIKNSGLSLIIGAIQRFVERGGKLRVITTTYMGASDPTAIERLSKLANTEVKVSYDTRSSRLHAKAYFIHRDTGLSCAYIGSANLSRAAITDGLEWTLKIPSAELPDLFRRSEAEFESYWESPNFHLYCDGDLSKFIEASNAERNDANPVALLTLFQLSPRPYQQAVLDNLQKARANHNHYRNLVVAATGTGKTLIAAFDYKAQCQCNQTRPSLLFLVHRKEILQQAVESFRHVLQDGDFGELLVDGSTPTSHQYLFCSVASFHSQSLVTKFLSNYWEIVILDEAHHGEASTYRPILTELKPRILLGLTATPERGDGVSIAKDFDYPLAAEIRLPDALDQKLLCPFHYYAISDNTDFSTITWVRGKYSTAELENLLTSDDIRVGLIIKKIVEYLPSPLRLGQFDSDYVKGLGFCVSKAHARFMAEKFSEAGIAAASLDSGTNSQEREKIRKQLIKGELNFIFVVDLYNEGVDIPEVNTILFLRPTESHVIYLQQFGRGLRRTNDEKHLTVLDFIGKSRREFRFDLRLTSLLPGKRNDLRKEIEHGFPHLPAGCYINFEKTAKERIFENIKRTYQNIDLRIRESFSQWKGGLPPTFTEFIEATGENPIELLTKRTWSDWKDLAGFISKPLSNTVVPELNSQARLSLVNSPNYLDFIIKALSAPDTSIPMLENDPYAQSFYHLIWNKKGLELGFANITDAIIAIRADSRNTTDLLEIARYATERADAAMPPSLPFGCPLELHGIYSRQEIFAAFGKATVQSPSPNREGVMHLPESNTSLHLFTFKKSEKFFSETTSYRDYPISQTRLHWETQSSTTQKSPIGKAYLAQPGSSYTVLLFARIETRMGNLSSPLCYLGPADLISAKGNKPIEMVWELRHPMPYEFFIEAKRAAGVS